MIFDKSHKPLIIKDDKIALGKSRETSRIWHLPKANECCTVPAYPPTLSHSRVVLLDQKYFKITKKFRRTEIPEYYGPILYAAMKRGAVRVLIDINKPHIHSSIEGVNIDDLIQTAQWINSKVIILTLSIIIRQSKDDSSRVVHTLHHHDGSLKSFCDSGQTPAPSPV